MSDMFQGWASVELHEELYPRDAVQAAAYVFLDRAHLFLERAGDKRIRVRLRPKEPVAGREGVAASEAAAAALAGDFENEALYQAYRRRLASEHKELIESLVTRAIAGAAGPPGLDELLAMDIGPETAFDDPLGIAMSWEEKYAKKKEPAPQAEPEPEAKESGPGGG